MATTAKGFDGSTPASFIFATATREETTPSGPSWAPPPGTESRWDPVRTASGPGIPHHAQMLAFMSVTIVRANSVAFVTNHSRKATSSGRKQNRE